MYFFKIKTFEKKPKMTYITNTTICNNGQFCNQLIRNICSSQIAKKYNLKFTYISYPETLELGIPLYIDGQFYYDSYIDFSDGNFEDYITNNHELKQNIDVTKHFFQNPFIALHIRNYLTSDAIKPNIIQKNKFIERYNNNNDLCIHVRLGDTVQFNPGFEYYDNMIQNQIPEYDKAYITSDEITHPICKALIEKYDLTVFNSNALETLMFGSTCKYILLSSGTFSWMMGILGFNSKVFYPNVENRDKWHGDIFVFDDWIKET